MPLVRMVTSVAGVDFTYQAGEEVAMSPEDAQRAVTAGWGEIVRGDPPQTPEGAVVRTARPETPEGDTARGRRVQRRGPG